MTDEARLRLDEGRRLLDSGDPQAAITVLAQLTGHPDPNLAGEAWLLIGTAQYRLDDEAGALSAWQRSAQIGGRGAWQGWKAIAEQHVRDGDLPAAIEAYQEADRRAPGDERGAIANRLAWLLKETGHDFAARRQFNRARGPYGSYGAYVTWALIAINVVVFVLDLTLPTDAAARRQGVGQLTELGALYGPLVFNGEWWRLLTYAFLHSDTNFLHIAFNMYALYLFGPVVEELYGHVEYLVIYVLCALGGGVLTILAAPDQAAVGASGAIFGLFGLSFVVWRFRHLVLGGRARALLSQIGTLLVLNLVITFVIPGISWTGHVGGLAVGAALGLLLPPSAGVSLAGLFQAPGGGSLQSQMPPSLRVAAYAAVAVVLAVGILLASGGQLG